MGAILTIHKEWRWDQSWEPSEKLFATCCKFGCVDRLRMLDLSLQLTVGYLTVTCLNGSVNELSDVHVQQGIAFSDVLLLVWEIIKVF